MNSAEFKHLYALREEISGWRFLHLDPYSLRSPGERFGAEQLESSGANIARVLHRIQMETATVERPEGSLADISADLNALIKGVRRVSVIENDQTKKWEVLVHSKNGGVHSASVASDGTMRILALLAALYDPKYRGLICFEEPENGVHPLRLRQLVRFMRGLVCQPGATEDLMEVGLSQMVVNSHSPVVLAAMDAHQAVLLDSISRKEEGSGGQWTQSTVSRVRLVQQEGNVPLPGAAGDIYANRSEVDHYRAAALLEDLE